jgi:hypothetical protein
MMTAVLLIVLAAIIASMVPKRKLLVMVKLAIIPFILEAVIVVIDHLSWTQYPLNMGDIISDSFWTAIYFLPFILVSIAASIGATRLFIHFVGVNKIAIILIGCIVSAAIVLIQFWIYDYLTNPGLGAMKSTWNLGTTVYLCVRAILIGYLCYRYTIKPRSSSQEENTLLFERGLV